MSAIHPTARSAASVSPVRSQMDVAHTAVSTGDNPSRATQVALRQRGEGPQLTSDEARDPRHLDNSLYDSIAE